MKYIGINASFVSIQESRLSCETIEQGAMLDVDTEPARVVAFGDGSPAEPEGESCTYIATPAGW